MDKREVYLVSGVRTAIGDYGGALKNMPPVELGAKVIEEAITRAGIKADDVDHCVMGNVIHTERRDMYLSRAAAMTAGIPETTPALTLNRLCGSGLQAVVSATQMILTGDADIAVAGGAESMSRAPYWIPSARFGARMGDTEMVDAMTGALTCPMDSTHMGITAENIAEEWTVTREEQDQLALTSHSRAEKAIKEGLFESQILPLELVSRKKTTVFNQDEHVRFGATIDDYTKLRPAFKKDGSVTAGNASGLNDAAAALILADKSAVEKHNLTPMAKIKSYAVAGVAPKFMGMGPVPAIKSVLSKAGLSVADIDVWELNEAFAAQALGVCKELDLPMDKVNPNGSGISLGHPIGATGAIITVKALYELERIQGKYAVISLCIGGGQGIAALIERA
ncbi:beta-ketothiolase BktB [Sessilibacter corallicola]|uniref:Acetyl-CoA C-acyltransferase family protein n=1 Tax=Sessilibacter corallicola TaxID=2904075 RepID=A0ABQ0AAZ8_9GAMM|nr:beta-ketothiolase BktB [Sessilibacter corallicola]MCE2028257.1 beta-ketothiolase BktB [Sessilibacter corallicola]